MKKLLILILGYSLVSASYGDVLVEANQSVNPCEYINTVATNTNQLDTGDDENFERIKQQRNREMVLACQDYEIKRLREAKSDLDRDNY